MSKKSHFTSFSRKRMCWCLSDKELMLRVVMIRLFLYWLVKSSKLFVRSTEWEGAEINELLGDASQKPIFISSKTEQSIKLLSLQLRYVEEDEGELGVRLKLFKKSLDKLQIELFTSILLEELFKKSSRC